MRHQHRARRPVARGLLAVGLAACLSVGVSAKEKDKTPTPPPVDPNDTTLRLFQAIDNTHGGKLTDFYVVADVYRDPQTPEEEYQHILKADYDKSRYFGKLQLLIRSVAKIHPDQMKTYTPKDFYEFGLTDLEKFMKSEPGTFGQPGDLYLKADAEHPLTSTPVTDQVRKQYELLVSQHLIPAMQKK